MKGGRDRGAHDLGKLLTMLSTAYSAAPPPRATTSDAEIIAALASGHSLRGIARDMKVSPKRIMRLRDQASTIGQADAPVADDGIDHAAIAILEDLLPPAAQLDAILLEAEMPAPRAQAFAIEQEVIRAPEKASKPLTGGALRAPAARAARGRRFVLTSAQNNTDVHAAFFESLLLFCDEVDAELMISGYSYNKEAFGNAEFGRLVTKGETYFCPEVTPYLVNESVELCPGLIFSGELDILPTATDPLSGLHTYHREASGIVPHAKVAKRSLPTMKGKPARELFATGTVTQRNYIARKSGQKATFHHTYAALYVAVDPDGTWFARQLVADEDGVFHDFGRRFSPEGSSYARVAAIQWPDMHSDNDGFLQEVMDAISGRGGMLDQLRPREQFFHDIYDCAPRNHHNLKDPYFLAAQRFSRVDGADSMEASVGKAARVLQQAARPFCKSYVVESNHDRALTKWCREADGHRDPVNARYWHYLNYQIFSAIERGDRGFMILEKAIADQCPGGKLPENVAFLRPNESHVSWGIEHGLHGDLGPNGVRGSPQAFRSMGTKLNLGHAHTDGIIEGIYTAGVMGSEMGYNNGPGSWSVTLTLTYENSKRSLVTLRGTRWREDQMPSPARSGFSNADLEDIFTRA